MKIELIKERPINYRLNLGRDITDYILWGVAREQRAQREIEETDL